MSVAHAQQAPCHSSGAAGFRNVARLMRLDVASTADMSPDSIYFADIKFIIEGVESVAV
jgi:hypothetical protein